MGTPHSRRHRCGLRSARDNRDPLQGFDDGSGGITRFEDLIQKAGADAGEENDHFDLAAKEPGSEVEGLRVIRQRHFPHGRGDYR